MDDSEEAEDNCPVYCLREDLEDEQEVLAGEYTMAKAENEPAPDIAKKLAALQEQEALIEQANEHLVAIRDEINKGEQSMLRVDRSLSNDVYTYITLHSFNEWRKVRQGAAGVQPGAPDELVPAAVKSEAKKAPRTKLLQQEDAILAELGERGIEPKDLPRETDGKPGIKAGVREALGKSPLFKGKRVFDKAWERVRKTYCSANKV
ncbi:MAG: hypothetical protein K1X42_17215 [Opitutaceae bacterium]|nr:hypothetical protein [Opitutaceae bacterium]